MFTIVLKKSTKDLIRIAKKERPKATKAIMSGFWDGQKSNRSVARTKSAGILRSNRKFFGNKEARRLVLRGHGYGK